MHDWLMKYLESLAGNHPVKRAAVVVGSVGIVAAILQSAFGGLSIQVAASYIALVVCGIFCIPLLKAVVDLDFPKWLAQAIMYLVVLFVFILGTYFTLDLLARGRISQSLADILNRNVSDKVTEDVSVDINPPATNTQVAEVNIESYSDCEANSIKSAGENLDILTFLLAQCVDVKKVDAK